MSEAMNNFSLRVWADEAEKTLKDQAAEIESLRSEIQQLKARCQTQEQQLNALLNHCPNGECHVCAEIICPHKCDWHFHHDGCPACAQLDAAIDAAKEQQ